MDYEKFIKKIAFSKELNPFHASFEKESLFELVSKLDISEDDKSGFSLAIYSLFSNPYYEKFTKFMETTFNNKNDAEDYYLYSIIIANNDTIVLHKEIHKNIFEADTFNLLSMSSMKLETSQESIRADNLSDQLIDQLDFNFNFLKFTSDKKYTINKKRINTEMFNDFYKYFFMGNAFSVLKTIYERICFENYKCDFNNNVIIIRNKYKDYDLLKAVAHYRIQTNMMLSAQYSLRDQGLSQICRKNPVYTAKKINDIKINSHGEIEITINNVEYNDDLESYYMLNFNALIQNYYYYMPNDIIDKIKPFLRLYTVIQYCAIKIKEYASNYKTDEKKFSFTHYLFNIKCGIFVKIIKTFTNEEINVIQNFLENIENDGTKSFWTYPLIKNGSSYIFIIHSILTCNIFHVIDSWVDNNLKYYNDIKGKDYENYVKEQIIKNSNEKNFFCKIIDSSKFSAGTTYEEIDIVWETKNCIIIGEIKNIRYPFTSRNIHGYLKTLEEASSQVIRKTKYLLDNKEHFKDIDLEKSIINCVITNYPFGTGLNIGGIPVIDYGVINAYISVGYNAKILFDKDEKQFDIVKYYNNEEEYSNNMKNYFERPSAVVSYEENLTSEEIEYNLIPNLKLNMLNILMKDK